MPWIMWLLIQSQYIFHVPDVFACHASYAPSLFEPRLYLIFFSALQTLIPEIESTSPSSTSLSANKFIVHLDLPSGGFEQARPVSLASTLVSIFGGAPLRGFSVNANSRPSSQYLFLILTTVVLLTFKAFTTSASDLPSS